MAEQLGLHPGQSVELLKELHILTREGKLNQDSRRKLKPVNHLLQFIEPLLQQVLDAQGDVTLADHGAGKSTLLSTLAGLRKPASGAVLLEGEDAALLHPRQAALRRAWLGQFQNDPFGSTVLETALTGRHPHLGRWDWESTRDAELARGALRAVGLAGMEERQIHTLSGGERQRLTIATLLTQAAPLYLLDEPLSHLDLNHQMAVLELFAGTARLRTARG